MLTAQLKFTATKQLWSKFSGEEFQDSYRLTGASNLEIATSEGSFGNQINLDVTVDEIPF